jgi:uncharacterized protein (TIGR03435 family)
METAMLRRVCVISSALTMAAWGQAPAFEVASVRVSQAQGGGGMHDFGRRDSVQVAPDGVTMRNVSMKGCTKWAFHVMDYQVTGPDWINSQRYDIVAKASGAVDEDRLRLMMQTLLSERFKMATHRQTKEMQAYLLQVGKTGIKFKETQADGEMDIKPDQARMSVSVQRAGVSQLIDILSNIFRAPVIDQTELKGRYDVTLNLAKYMADFAAAHGTGGGGGEAPPDPQAIILRGLQEELGLKMEPKRMPIDLVVIDRAEKVPAEN